uniref:Laccase n=1 Tax=Leucocoprinus sp. Tra.sp1.C\|nr:laccase [Leucocoprinus sp. Tra.sp1.C\
MRTALSLLGSLVSTVLFVGHVQGVSIGPTADMYIVNEDISPDGFNRSAVLAGDAEDSVSFPGPLVVGTKGSTFKINVIDDLTDTTMLRSTSIHWHGMFQNGTAWADGTSGVTQCPISPGNSFLYQFTATDQAGTFWYHSHRSTQYCDGLRGALVIYDDDDPYLSEYSVDNETTVIALADWYHTPAPSAGTVPTSDATLINGLGRYASGPASDLAVIQVEQGVKYRFRLVSISCDPNFTFSIDNHTMTIIEVDGNNVEPVVADSIQIFASQRYSFILNANQTISNYWIRAQPNVGTTGYDGGINSAILRYLSASEEEPTTPEVTTTNLLAETSLIPLENPGAPGGSDPADVAYNLAITFNGSAFAINDATYIEEVSLPVLLQILSGTTSAQDLLPDGSVYTLPRNSTIELSLPGGAVGSPHPFHLHGHAFDVIRSAGSSTYNYVNPPRRDTVSLGETGDNVTIRFSTYNPGPWILHCHIDWHLDIGLAVVMAEAPSDIENLAVTDSWSDLCSTYADQDSGT